MGAHLRPTNGTQPAGVYRVVGTRSETVTLLRVGDADGSRVVTGEVVTVERDALAGFERTDPPSGSAGGVTGSLTMVYWSLRAFAGSLAGSPVATLVGVGLIAAGLIGDRFVTLPGPADGVAILLGSLTLAAIGSGRL